MISINNIKIDIYYLNVWLFYEVKIYIFIYFLILFNMDVFLVKKKDISMVLICVIRICIIMLF